MCCNHSHIFTFGKENNKFSYSISCLLLQSFFKEITTGNSDAVGYQMIVDSNNHCLGWDRGWEPRSKQGGKTTEKRGQDSKGGGNQEK